MCSRCFKLCRTYSISLYSSDVGEFFWSWILKDCIRVQEKKKRVVVLCSRPQFHIVVVQRRQRNVQNSVIHVQSCCFCQSNPLAFLPSSLPSLWSLLKLPTNVPLKTMKQRPRWWTQKSSGTWIGLFSPHVKNFFSLKKLLTTWVKVICTVSLGWFSNRTGTSFDDGKAREKD